MVPRVGVEPTRLLRPWDFKSHVSTNFTTQAFLNGVLQRIRTSDPLIKSQVLYRLS